MYHSKPPQPLLDSSVLSDLELSSLERLHIGTRQSAQLSRRENSEFVQGINFGGETVVVHGNRMSGFESLKRASADEFQEVERDWGIRPLADSTSKLLGTGIQETVDSKDLKLSVPLKDGTYQAELLVASSNTADSVFSVRLEGRQTDTVKVKEGKFTILPYQVLVSDGRLDIALEKERKSPILLGMQLFKPNEFVELDVEPVVVPEPKLKPTPSELPTLKRPKAELFLPETNDDGRAIWSDDFSGNWQRDWSGFRDTTAPENRKVIRDPSGQFAQVLRVDYGKGEVGPRGGTQFKSFIKPMQSATLEYYLRFKDGFDPALGGKLPGLTGGRSDRRLENTGGRSPDGTDGWSVRLGFRPAKSNPNALALRTYSYLPPGQQEPKQNNEYVIDAWGNKTFWSGKGKWGLSNHFLDPDRLGSGSDLHIKTGEWYKISLRVDLNTPGQNDGSIKGFIQEPGSHTSQLALHVPHLKFQNKGHSLPIDRIFFSTFFGGSSQAHQARRDEHIDFADFRLISH